MALIDGLVGLWHQNNTWSDSSGKNNNGTATGAIFDGVNQKLGSHAGSFDGIDDYVDVGTNASLDVQGAEFSVMAWVRVPETGLIDKPIFSNASQADGFRGFALVINRRFGVSPNANIDLQKRGVIDQNIAFTFNANTWYHIVVTQHYSGGSPSEVKFYADGAYLGNYTNTTAYYASTGDPKHIGKNISGDGGLWKGLIDELAVWNRAITAAEVTELYNSGTGIEMEGTGDLPTVDMWYKELSRPVFDIKKQQYLYQNTPNFIIEPILEVITLDKWYKELNRPVFDARRQQYLYPSIFYDTQSLLNIEPITLDKWYKELSRPIFDVDRQQYLYPSSYFDLSIILNYEELTLDKWATNIIQPIFDVKRQQHLYPNSFTNIYSLTILEGITMDKWYIGVNQPIFDIKKHQYLYPVIFYDTNSLTQLELITLDKWYKEVNKPIFDKRRQQYLYPYKGYDNQIYLKPIVNRYSPLLIVSSNWSGVSNITNNWGNGKDA